MPVSERPLRADAERNRRLLLDAAKELFAERGLGVTLDDIARHAGVGVGTAYRRFGGREALVDALFEEQVEGIVSLARDGVEAEDPWEGLVGFLERSLALQAADRGLKEVLLGTGERHERIGRIRDQMRPLVTEMIRRAQEAGELRADFAPQDMPLLQIMLGSVIDASSEVAPDLWRRCLGIMLDGIRTDGATRPAFAVDPVSWKKLNGVLACWRPPQRRPAAG
jgi:AcrR family transcriptional regulator